MFQKCNMNDTYITFKTLFISFPYTDKTVGKRGALPTELRELLENEGMFSRYRSVN